MNSLETKKEKILEKINIIIIIANLLVYWGMLIVGIVYVCKNRPYLGEFSFNFDWLFTIFIGIWIFLPFVKKLKIGNHEIETNVIGNEVENLKVRQEIIESIYWGIYENLKQNIEMIENDSNLKNKETENYYNTYNYSIVTDISLIQKYIELKAKGEVSEVKPINVFNIIQELKNKKYIDEKEATFLSNMCLSMKNSNNTEKTYENIRKNYKKIQKIIERIK